MFSLHFTTPEEHILKKEKIIIKKKKLLTSFNTPEPQPLLIFGFFMIVPSVIHEHSNLKAYFRLYEVSRLHKTQDMSAHNHDINQYQLISYIIDI